MRVNWERWAAASGLCPAVLRQSEVELLRLGLIAVTSRGRVAMKPWGDGIKRSG